MLRSIKIVLDGSACSQASVELAIRWAQRLHGIVTGVVIVDGSTIMVRTAESHRPQSYDSLLAEAYRQAGQTLDQLAWRCGQLGIPFERPADVGQSYKQIIREAQHCDVLLLGQHSYFRYHAPFWDDETTKRVIQYAPCSVVVIPEKLVDGSGILVAYDGHVQAARTLQVLLATGVSAKSPLWVMSVAESVQQAEHILAPAVAFLAGHDIGATPLPIADTHADKAILTEAQRHGVGCIVLGAYRQPQFRDLFLGSVTQSVLEQTQFPVFLCH